MQPSAMPGVCFSVPLLICHNPCLVICNSYQFFASKLSFIFFLYLNDAGVLETLLSYQKLAGESTRSKKFAINFVVLIFVNVTMNFKIDAKPSLVGMCDSPFPGSKILC